MEEQTYNFQKKKSNWLSTSLIALFLLLAITVLSGFIGFGKQGFNISTVLQQFTVYVAFGVGALLGIIILEFIFRNIKKDDNASTFFNSPRFKFLSNPIKLLLLSLIIFSILGLLTTVFNQNTFFLGVGSLKEQFTPFDGILYNWTLVVTSENLGAAFFGGFLVLLLYFAANKWKFKDDNFKYLSIIIFIIAFIAYGFILHQLRYSQSEPDLMRVIVFWGIGGIVTALTGSVIPFLAMHGMNNTFVELAQNYSREASIIPIIIFIVVLVVLYVLLYGPRRKKP